jgi:hypothetical protein
MRHIGGSALPVAQGVRFVRGRFFALAVSIATAVAAVPAQALAQNLDEGKTPQQLFAADCAACHKSPQSVGRNASVGFLRQHYTSSARSASLLAGYLASAGAAPNADRQKTKGEDRETRARRKKGDQAAVTRTGEPTATPPTHQPGRKDSRKSRRPLEPVGSAPAATPAPSAATSLPAAEPATANRAAERAEAATVLSERQGAPPPPPFDEAATAALAVVRPPDQAVFAAPLP